MPETTQILAIDSANTSTVFTDTEVAISHSLSRGSELPIAATAPGLAAAPCTTCPPAFDADSLFPMDDLHEHYFPTHADLTQLSFVPLLGTGSSDPPTDMSSGIPRIPFELYRPIFSFVSNPHDLRNLAVASRITQPDAERFLHATVSARGMREVASRVRFLARNPRVAALVRTIIFRDREGESRTWGTCVILPSFYALIAAALRNTIKLSHLDASILPSVALPIDVPFRLETFVHDSLVIGFDAVRFFSEQSSIKNLTLNPFSYYELHEDDEHYRRLLYTILPNLTSLSCGLSVAIRLVRNKASLDRLIIPNRPDCLDSDQLERLVRALVAAAKTVQQQHQAKEINNAGGNHYARTSAGAAGSSPPRPSQSTTATFTSAPSGSGLGSGSASASGSGITVHTFSHSTYHHQQQQHLHLRRASASHAFPGPSSTSASTSMSTPSRIAHAHSHSYSGPGTSTASHSSPAPLSFLGMAAQTPTRVLSFNNSHTVSTPTVATESGTLNAAFGSGSSGSGDQSLVNEGGQAGGRQTPSSSSPGGSSSVSSSRLSPAATSPGSGSGLASTFTTPTPTSSHPLPKRSSSSYTSLPPNANSPFLSRSLPPSHLHSLQYQRQSQYQRYQNLSNSYDAFVDAGPPPSLGPLRTLIVERRFSNKEGLMYIARELKSLEYLSLNLAWGSQWLKELRLLPYIRALSLTSGDPDSFFSNSVSVSSAASSLDATVPNPVNVDSSNAPLAVSSSSRRRRRPRTHTTKSSDSDTETDEMSDRSSQFSEDDDDYENEGQDDMDMMEPDAEELGRLEALRAACPRLRDVYVRDRDRYRYAGGIGVGVGSGGAGAQGQIQVQVQVQRGSVRHLGSTGTTNGLRLQGVNMGTGMAVGRPIGIGIGIGSGSGSGNAGRPQPQSMNDHDAEPTTHERLMDMTGTRKGAGTQEEDKEARRLRQIEAMDEPAEHWAYVPRPIRRQRRARHHSRHNHASAKGKAKASRHGHGQGKGVGRVEVGTSDDEREWAERYGLASSPSPLGSGYADEMMHDGAFGPFYDDMEGLEMEMDWRWVCLGVVDVRHVPGFAYESESERLGGF